MPTTPRKRIGSLLVEHGLIREDQLVAALQRQKKEGGKLVKNLIALESITPEAFTELLARQKGLLQIQIGQYGVPGEVLSLVPREFAIQHEVFPLDRMGDTLVVGMICPLDTSTIQELEETCGLSVMPVLCSGTDLRASIDRNYGPHVDETEIPADAIGTSLRLAGIPSTIRQIGELPTLPLTVRKVREAIDDPEISAKEVGSIIATDPPLAARLLSIANSPAYGFPHQVTSIHLAVSLLGLEETYSIVLSAAVVDLIKGSRTFDYRSFWVRSMLCGTLCKITAQTAGFAAKPGVFTAGLLLDIGRLALAEVAPQRYAAVNHDLRGLDLVAAEEKALGIGHPEAGYLLASAWGLPDELAETIRIHHTPEHAKLNPEAAAIAVIGNTMAYLTLEEREDPSALSAPCAQSLAVLRIDDESIIEMFDQMRRILKSEFLLQQRWSSDARKSPRAD
jgi:HD-like signal output (HDOD) protein